MHSLPRGCARSVGDGGVGQAVPPLHPGLGNRHVAPVAAVVRHGDRRDTPADLVALPLLVRAHPAGLAALPLVLLRAVSAEQAGPLVHLGVAGPEAAVGGVAIPAHVVVGSFELRVVDRVRSCFLHHDEPPRRCTVWRWGRSCP